MTRWIYYLDICVVSIFIFIKIFNFTRATKIHQKVILSWNCLSRDVSLQYLSTRGLSKGDLLEVLKDLQKGKLIKF